MIDDVIFGIDVGVGVVDDAVAVPVVLLLDDPVVWVGQAVAYHFSIGVDDLRAVLRERGVGRHLLRVGVHLGRSHIATVERHRHFGGERQAVGRNVALAHDAQLFVAGDFERQVPILRNDDRIAVHAGVFHTARRIGEERLRLRAGRVGPCQAVLVRQLALLDGFAVFDHVVARPFVERVLFGGRRADDQRGERMDVGPCGDRCQRLGRCDRIRLRSG